MIHRLTVKDPAKAVCPWWSTVEWLKGRESIEFGPGLNVIFGKNGSGKSTILTTIAKLLCCYDGDQQLVGQHTTTDMTEYDSGTKTRKLRLGVNVEHDGSPIMHFDPSQRVGLIGGSFDWDFGDAGLRNTMFHGSSGQTCMMRMNRCLAAAFRGEWPELVWKTHKQPELVALLAGDGTKVRPTLLLDEPSSNLDLRTEIMLMQGLQRIANSGVQVIVATHSVFALHFDGATIIDTTKDYADMAKFDVEMHFLSALMKEPKRLELMMGFVKEHRGSNPPSGE